MFGKATSELFDELPQLEDLASIEAKRMLSLLYLDVFDSMVDATRESGSDHTITVNYLRRLANVLECELLGRERNEEVKGGLAFVAAESLSLMSSLLTQESVEVDYRLADLRIAIKVEAALLYLAAGFDANASTVLRGTALTRSSDSGRQIEAAHAEACLEAILALCRLRKAPSSDVKLPTIGQIELNSRAATRALLFNKLRESIVHYLQWLRLEDDDGLLNAQNILVYLRSMLEETGGSANHADIYHLLKLVECAVTTTSKRSLRTIPSPSQNLDVFYREYLQSRASGSSKSHSRLLLWPGHLEFVRQCLPGPNKHAVISVPTGSGKSFIAELAISHAGTTGWILYLVPTNALANQVRLDLESAFADFDHYKIRAFLGADSYTYSVLPQDRVTETEPGTVAVMTPEKCALALRLSPEAFKNCTLCIFDECHLISESQRGVLAELVLGHVMSIAKHCKFVLLSALMSNPGELAHWLKNATQLEAAVIHLPWRPTRSMRGVIGVNSSAYIKERKLAKERLDKLPSSKKKEKFTVEHVLVANLQGPWSTSAPKEYAVVKLPTTATFEVNRQGKAQPLKWVNSTCGVLAEHISKHGLPVLAFLPKSKHYPFSVGRAIEGGGVTGSNLSEEVEALVEIANDELGVSSVVGELLQKHIAIHTGALLDSEKRASELSFKEGSSTVMFATGTLAQGLNLPASVVLIGGTSVGYSEGGPSVDTERRAKAQILNAFGRAGRAGVANHGLGVVVTDKPISFANVPDAERARRDAKVMVEDEDSTALESRLQGFLSEVLAGTFDPDLADVEELAALSYLPIQAELDITASEILSRSFAIHRRSPERRTEEAELAGEVLADIGINFIQQAKTPDWIPAISYRTGMPFFTCWRMVQAFRRTMDGGEFEPTLEGWLGILFEALKLLPPQRARDILQENITDSIMTPLWDDTISGDDPLWNPSESWLQAWQAIESCVLLFMKGKRVSTISKTLLAQTGIIDKERNSGAKPLPRTLEFINKTVDRIAQSAGILVAVQELVPKLDPGFPVIDLNDAEFSVLASLPLAIRHGANTRDSLAWYRFGIRFRRAAHLLSRVYPIPQNISSDTDVQNWITARIREVRDTDEVPGTLSGKSSVLYESIKTYLVSAW